MESGEAELGVNLKKNEGKEDDCCSFEISAFKCVKPNFFSLKNIYGRNAMSFSVIPPRHTW